MTISAFHWYVEHDPHEFQQKARGIYSADEWTPRAKSAVRSYGGPRADTEKRPERRQSLDSLSKVFFLRFFSFLCTGFPCLCETAYEGHPPASHQFWLPDWPHLCRESCGESAALIPAPNSWAREAHRERPRAEAECAASGSASEASAPAGAVRTVLGEGVRGLSDVSRCRGPVSGGGAALATRATPRLSRSSSSAHTER